MKPRPRFDLEADAEKKNRPSYMPTRGLAAVLNQGLQSIGFGESVTFVIRAGHDDDKHALFFQVKAPEAQTTRPKISIWCPSDILP